MLKKTCPYCHKDSYSSTDFGKWICPYCQKDISHQKGEVAGSKNVSDKDK